MQKPETLIGQKIGSYALDRILGRGRLNLLFQATSPYQQTVVLTIFTVARQLAPQARHRFLSRFIQEVSSMSPLHHPGILAVEDFGEFNESPYMVVPSVSGSSLATLIKQGTRWTPISAFPVIQAVGNALSYAHHRGVLHGGLIPVNIVRRDDLGVQVTGFGMGRLLARYGIEGSDRDSWAHILSVIGTVIGKIEYVAPECIQGQPPDERTDIYALACILYEMCSGQPPFMGTPLDMLKQHLQMLVPSLRISHPNLSFEIIEAVDAVLRCALTPDPSRRYESVDEFVGAYRKALQIHESSDLD